MRSVLEQLIVLLVACSQFNVHYYSAPFTAFPLLFLLSHIHFIAVFNNPACFSLVLIFQLLTVNDRQHKSPDKNEYTKFNVTVVNLVQEKPAGP